MAHDAKQPGLLGTIGRGIVAGAAGTTALNAVSFTEMLWQGRTASSAPAEVVDRIAHALHTPVPGSADKQRHRLSALGALGGIAVGCGIGAIAAVLHREGLRLPWYAGAVITGTAAMAASDIPMTSLGVSDLRTWTSADWMSDSVPHLAYGLATYYVVSLAVPRKG